MLKPGGRLLISDYCKGEGKASPGFASYIEQRGYFLHTVDSYGNLLRDAGFQSVAAEDRTWQVYTFFQLYQIFLVLLEYDLLLKWKTVLLNSMET